MRVDVAGDIWQAQHDVDVACVTAAAADAAAARGGR